MKIAEAVAIKNLMRQPLFFLRSRGQWVKVRACTRSQQLL